MISYDFKSGFKRWLGLLVILCSIRCGISSFCCTLCPWVWSVRSVLSFRRHRRLWAGSICIPPLLPLGIHSASRLFPNLSNSSKWTCIFSESCLNCSGFFSLWPISSPFPYLLSVYGCFAINTIFWLIVYLSTETFICFDDALSKIANSCMTILLRSCFSPNQRMLISYS